MIKLTIHSKSLKPKVLPFLLMLLSTFLLSSCGSSEDDELQQYITEIKSRPPKPIEPIPQFQKVKQFVYPETEQRRNPFKPKIIMQQVDALAPNTKRPKQPLEAFPLDALKFVGTLKEGSTVWALISQPQGLVSRAKSGNFMGQNFGQIISISDEGVKIEETVQINGKWEKKLIVLKLNQPETKK